jgi:hypothetical protein
VFSGRLGLVLAMTSGVSIFNQCNEDGGEADIELGVGTTNNIGYRNR